MRTCLRFAAALALVGWRCGGEPPAPHADLPTWQVSTTPSVTIGGEDERPDYLLERVMGTTRLSNGTIVVLDGGPNQLKLYTSDGRHLRTVGGEGEGPGEMRGTNTLVRLPGDTLVVLSMSPGLSWFAPDGEFVRQMTTSVWSVPSGPCRSGEGSWHLLPRDGSLFMDLEENLGNAGCSPMPEGVWRTSGILVHYDWWTHELDTLTEMPATERHGGGWRVYGRRLELAAGTDGRIYAADTGADSILRFSAGFDTSASFSTPFPTRSVPRSARRQRGSDMGGRPWRYDYPDQYPRLAKLMVDAVGDLWVMAYPPLRSPRTSIWDAEGGARWVVLTPDGAPLARVRTPSHFVPKDIGADYVLGISRDERGVQRIDGYALTRNGDSGL